VWNATYNNIVTRGFFSVHAIYIVIVQFGLKFDSSNSSSMHVTLYPTRSSAIADDYSDACTSVCDFCMNRAAATCDSQLRASPELERSGFYEVLPVFSILSVYPS